MQTQNTKAADLGPLFTKMNIAEKTMDLADKLKEMSTSDPVQNELITTYKNKILAHDESGKLSCYTITKGEMHPEMKEVADKLFDEAIMAVKNK